MTLPSSGIRSNRVCVGPVCHLPLQLLLQLMEEAPVGALGDDLLRARLDHAHLMEAEGIEAYAVLGIILALSAVRNVPHSLEGVFVALREASVHEKSRDPLRLEGAEIGGLQDRPQGALGGDRMLPHERRVPATIQQKYWDQGRSTALLTMTRPNPFARSSGGKSAKARKASIFPSSRTCTASAVRCVAQWISLPGSRPTYATMLARKT